MSWFFSSSKKKEPPVTVDPTPIEDQFYFVPDYVQTQPSNFQPLYPNLNGEHSGDRSSLPYSLSPSTTSTVRSDNDSLAVQLSEKVKIEPSNQLESIPFRISPKLQADMSLGNDDNSISLNEFTESLKRVKEFFNSSEFEYDFDLEKRIVREAKMVNGHVA